MSRNAFYSDGRCLSLSRDSKVEPDSVDNAPVVPIRMAFDVALHIEVGKAVRQMKCNKASGGDGIPVEVYNHGRATLVRLFVRMCDSEEELKDASVMTIFKKGSRTEGGNCLRCEDASERSPEPTATSVGKYHP